MGALGQYFLQNESASTLASAHICWALVVSQRIFFLFNKLLSLFFWSLVVCKLGLAFSQSFSSRFAIWQWMSNQGLWRCLSLQLSSKSLLPKVDSVATPTHCCSRLVNRSAPKCPIDSTTHRFPRFVVRASWYSLTFDLSYLNLGKKHFVTTVRCGSTKL